MLPASDGYNTIGWKLLIGQIYAIPVLIVAILVSLIDYCLKEIPVPTILLIAGASADKISLKKSKAFSEQFEQAKVHLIENGQHYLPLTNTAVVAGILENYYQFFLDES